MSTWHLFPDSSCDGFRWEVAGRIIQSADSDSTLESTAPLPSMADLLLQGCSKLIQKREESIPMFTTGLGKSVALNESSIARAKLILAGSENVLPEESGFGVPTFFQTASNKKVKLSSAAMARAKALLGLEEGDLNGATAIQHHSVTPDSVLPKDNGFGNSNTLFHTASNKKVNVSSAGLARAKALLGLEDDDLNGFRSSSSHQEHEFDSTAVQHHSVTPDSVLPKESGFGVPNNFFQTASNKKINVSSAGLARAKALLGLEENDLNGFNHVNGSSSSHQQHGFDATAVLHHSVTPDNVFPKESGFGGVPNTIFQTASNKKVNVSSAGMARAEALLGLEEDDLNGFNHVNRSSSSHQTHEKFGVTAVQHHSVTPGKIQYEGQRSEILSPSSKGPQTKFQTAGGKSLSVSTEALKRARSLLGDPELGAFFDDGTAGDQFVTPQNDKRLDGIAINNGSANTGYITHEGQTSNNHTSNSFISPLQSSSKQFRSVKLQGLASGGNLIKKFDAAVDETDCALNVTKIARHGLSNDRPLASDKAVYSSTGNGFIPRAKQFGRPANQPLVDITNRSTTAFANNKQDSINQKKRLGKTGFVSPFKRPRISSFQTPVKKNVEHASSGLSVVPCDTHYSKKVISTRYQERSPRVYIKDYFGMHPTATTTMGYVPDHIRRIKSSNADRYVFRDESSSNMVGAEAFLQMLAESGASSQHASRKWVTNHYRWIVWKLACYETYYPAKCRGNFLTITNVLEELKYRYEREVNHGHCSAIKRILSGDAPASLMTVLCISAINPKTNNDSQETHGSDSGSNVKIELTDGWYSMNAALDVVLTKQLNAGKLFVGQKLRILGAGLSGWATPTSPLEAVISNTIYLLLNINGTYRAHWADRLGFCKEVSVPLALNCIKSNGGPVPKTIAGITRIYPVLYKERLGEKKSIVRSERMESKMIQLHNQRRSTLVEGLICEHQRGINGVHSQNDTDSEEGAKIFKLLESVAEPELLMADMTREQLTSFSTYKSKFEAARQNQMEKSVSKALEVAGLNERNVSPFMRIRIVGLKSLTYEGEHKPKEGIVTIWNPTESQITELTEGKIFIMKGLVPMNTDSETLYLHGRGSSSRFQPLSPEASESFQPFFNPRKPITLPNLGEIPLSSEFDIAAYVVHVGDAYTDGQQKKQWLFVTDGSIQYPHSRSDKISHSLLAISFTTPSIDDYPIPNNLVGSVVGFCNLIKRAKDVNNDMWVCEATENSVYFVNAESPYSSHLKTSSGHIQTWAKLSSSLPVIHQLRRRVLFIIGAPS